MTKTKERQVEELGMVERHLADSYEQVQKVRVALGNRARAIEDGDDEHGIMFAKKMADDLKKKEEEIFQFMKDRAEGTEVYNKFLSKIKGMGPTLSTKLQAWLEPEKAPKPSSFVKYAGLGVEMKCNECETLEPRKPKRKKKESDEEWQERLKNYQAEKILWEGKQHGDDCPKCNNGTLEGQAQQRIAGKPTSFNPIVRDLMWNVTECFVRSNSQYKVIYDKEKQRKKKQGWGESDGHRSTHAKRKMGKIFLHHLWVVWRSILDLPTRSPYIEEYGNHSNIIEVHDIVPEVEVEIN